LKTRELGATLFGKRAWIPFLVLRDLGKIVTSTKFQKLVFLIHVEGRLRGYRFTKYPYGPYSNELEIDMQLANALGLIKRDFVRGVTHTYYTYELTSEGFQILENVLENISPDRIRKASRVIRKYGEMDYKKLMEYVYKRYIVPREEFRRRSITIRRELDYLKDVWKWKLVNEPRSIDTIYVLAIIEYAEKALEKAGTRVEDAVILGVCQATVSELIKKLSDLTLYALKEHVIRVDPEINEIFDFLQYYCSENNILPVIDELDFSDFIEEEDVKKLEEEFREANLY